MARTLRWDDAEDIAEALLESHPDADPVGCFTDLHAG
jgi:FeS assembly protein IscX